MNTSTNAVPDVLHIPKCVSNPCSAFLEQAALIAALRKELEEYKKAAPLCTEHEPAGGARCACVICSGLKLEYALSRCSYFCEEPNEIECSSYDVYMDERAVIEQVMQLRQRAETAERELAAARDEIQTLRWYGNKDCTTMADAAIKAARGKD